MPRKNKTYWACPRCKTAQDRQYKATSRRDNKTGLCSSCGVAEALEDAGLQPKWTGEIYWEETKT